MAAKGELHVDMLSKELQSILKKYPTLSLQKGREKIRCELSGHEMPCSHETVNTYINGKKFQKLLAQKTFEYEKYKQHIIPSTKKGRQHQLFCMLTLRHMNNLPDHIQKHLEGRRFLKAYKRWEECQRTGEVFKPLESKKKQEEQALDEEDSDKESDVDSLSDLYPAADFEDDGEEMEGDGTSEDVDNNHIKKNGRVATDSESDFEFEALEEEPEDTSKTSDPVVKTNKRKHKKEKTPKKQIKKKK
ncbi:surfeit locus protein 2-like [Ylistrum balloti]|uniref:surfeit locus protein 2-like n=1 Tax=Ylistrum balloti TaxID=509963 RepID=UPI002905936A|nr:surfeit locus protein 2-like [Ylistrum balloti]